MIVTIIGNGLSRESIPLDKITSSIKIGCNEIWKEGCVDYLCLGELDQFKDLLQSDYAGKVYYRYRPMKQSGLEPKENWYSPDFMQTAPSSGHAGIELAATLNPTRIDLLGFDCTLDRVYELSPGSSRLSWSPEENAAGAMRVRDLWISTLQYAAKSYPIRRIVDEHSTDIPEIPSITVKEYLKELDL